MGDSKNGFQVSEIIKNATREVEAKCYANYAQFVVINNEIFLDFYFIEPNEKDLSEIPSAKLVQRMVMPSSIAKGLASGIANTVLQYEKISNTIIPDQRGKHEDDLIDFWAK